MRYPILSIGVPVAVPEEPFGPVRPTVTACAGILRVARNSCQILNSSEGGISTFHCCAGGRRISSGSVSVLVIALWSSASLTLLNWDVRRIDIRHGRERPS